MLVNLAGGSFLSYWGNILAGALKVLIGVNLVQLAQPFDRDTLSAIKDSFQKLSLVRSKIFENAVSRTHYEIKT